MINWFNMPDEGLSNGGLFEVKELEVTENGTYETKGEMYNKVTVNVEGGGGSSDFNTAEVTIINQQELDCIFHSVLIKNGVLDFEKFADDGTIITVVTYQNEPTYSSITDLNGDTVIPTSVSGSIEYDSEIEAYKITGDCTITIS